MKSRVQGKVRDDPDSHELLSSSSAMITTCDGAKGGVLARRCDVFFFVPEEFLSDDAAFNMLLSRFLSRVAG